MSERIRGIAEIEVVHRDSAGNVKSIEKSKHPVILNKEGKIIEVI